MRFGVGGEGRRAAKRPAPSRGGTAGQSVNLQNGLVDPFRGGLGRCAANVILYHRTECGE